MLIYATFVDPLRMSSGQTSRTSIREILTIGQSYVRNVIGNMTRLDGAPLLQNLLNHLEVLEEENEYSWRDFLHR